MYHVECHCYLCCRRTHHNMAWEKVSFYEKSIAPFFYLSNIIYFYAGTNVCVRQLLYKFVINLCCSLPNYRNILTKSLIFLLEFKKSYTCKNKNRVHYCTKKYIVYNFGVVIKFYAEKCRYVHNYITHEKCIYTQRFLILIISVISYKDLCNITWKIVSTFFKNCL